MSSDVCFKQSCWGAVGGGCTAHRRGPGQGWPQGQDMADEESQAGPAMAGGVWWCLGSPVAMGPAPAQACSSLAMQEAGVVRHKARHGPKAQVGPRHLHIYKG